MNQVDPTGPDLVVPNHAEPAALFLTLHWAPLCDITAQLVLNLQDFPDFLTNFPRISPRPLLIFISYETDLCFVNGNSAQRATYQATC